jgi:hypothetical protein
MKPAHAILVFVAVCTAGVFGATDAAAQLCRSGCRGEMKGCFESMRTDRLDCLLACRQDGTTDVAACARGCRETYRSERRTCRDGLTACNDQCSDDDASATNNRSCHGECGLALGQCARDQARARPACIASCQTGPGRADCVHGCLAASSGGMAECRAEFDSCRAACGGATTTTIGTSTTTTTIAAPFCGDGVVNQASEECDGSDLGGAECPGSAIGAFPVCLGDCTLDFSPCEGGTTTSTTMVTTSTTIATTSTTVATTSTTSTSSSSSTTSSSSTSTTIGPFCGDGVVNQVSEECDGNDLNGNVCPGSAMGAFPVCLGDCTLDFSSCPGGTTTSTTVAPTTSTSTSSSTTSSSTTSSSTTTSTTTSSSTTTSTTVPTLAVLEFVTADPSLATASGVAKNGGAGGTTLKTLHVGGLNLGGGCNQNGGACGIVEGPTPGGSGNQFNASCSGTSCSISARTAAETGSLTNCSDVGCSFGTFLPISNTATSTCVRNVFAMSGSGTLDLSSGAFSGSVPLTSNTTLTGNGASPCPLCLGGTPLVVDSGTCDASWTDSSNNHSATEGVACTPSDSAGHTYDCVPFGADLGGLSVDLTPFSSGTVTADTGGTGDFCGQGATEPGSIGCFATHKSTGMVCDYIEEDGSDAAGISLDGGPVPAQLVSVFCVPPVGGIFGGLINGAADLPGPGATALPGTMDLTSAP